MKRQIEERRTVKALGDEELRKVLGGTDTPGAPDDSAGGSADVDLKAQFAQR